MPQCGRSESKFRDIGNPDLIQKRTSRVVPVGPGGTLSDYVPFYFTARSMMLYNILTGTNVARQSPDEIAVIVTSVPHLVKRGTPFVFTNGHAYMKESSFFTEIGDLGEVDWQILGNSDFSRSGADPGKSNRYQAELLIHRHVKIEDVLGLACFSDLAKQRYEALVANAGCDLKVLRRTGWYPR